MNNKISILKPKTQEELEKDFYKMPPKKLLLAGIKFDNLDAIKIAEKRGADLNYSSGSGVVLAVNNGSIKALSYLLSKPEVDPSNDGQQYALWCVVDKNNSYMLKKLLRHKSIDPFHNDNEIFKMSAESGLTKLVQIFLDDGRVTTNAIETSIEMLRFRLYNGTHKSLFGIKNQMAKHQTLDLLNDLQKNK